MKVKNCKKGCPYFQWTRLRKGRKVHICTSPRLEGCSIYERIIYDSLDKCPENDSFIDNPCNPGRGCHYP